ncbi:hypothetical protein [Nocardia sp. NPDC047038]
MSGKLALLVLESDVEIHQAVGMNATLSVASIPAEQADGALTGSP